MDMVDRTEEHEDRSSYFHKDLNINVLAKSESREDSMSIRFDFDESKATQVIGVLAARCGNLFDYYLAMKAIYALDREAIIRWRQPVIGGSYRMIPYGPINQDAMDATKSERQGFFSKCFERSGNEIKLVSDPGTLELSRAEIQLAERICDEWKGLGFGEAHQKAKSFPECSEMKPVSWIPPESILLSAGYTPQDIKDIEAELAESRMISDP